MTSTKPPAPSPAPTGAPPATTAGSAPATAGGVLLLLGVMLFLAAHLVVQSGWQPPYSWAANNISDLGNVTCGPWGPDRRYVCSPWHAWFNPAFIALGLCLTLGVVLTRRRIGLPATSVALLALAGAGFVMAGVWPADVDENNHVLGAVLIFFAGNGGLLWAGLSRRVSLPAGVRVLRIVSGLVGLAAALLFLGGHDLGLGPGGMERVGALVLLGWAALAGARAVATSRG